MSMIPKLFAVGSAYLAYKLSADSYNGYKPKWDVAFDAHEQENMYQYQRFGWGHYSGNPYFDHLAHWLEKQRLFGPNSLFAEWTKVKTHVGGFIHDVLARNIVPIGIAAAGMYAAFGNSLFAPVRWLSGMGGGAGGGAFGSILGAAGSFIGAAAGVAGRALSSLGGVLLRGGGGTLALAGIAAYALYRAARVIFHIEQHEFYTDDMGNPGGHH